MSQRESLPFLQRLVKHLVEERNIPIEILIRNKYALKDAAEKKINNHRQNVHQTAYENFLLPECATPVVVSPDHYFSFDPHGYPCNTRYTGHYQFQKHYYTDIGDLKSDGEEFQCAQFIDTLPEVKFWVRNLERQPRFSLTGFYAGNKPPFRNAYCEICIDPKHPFSIPPFCL